MKPKTDHVTAGAQGLFWLLLIVFGLLGVDYAFRAAALWQQRQQLHQARLMQAQNIDQLATAQEARARLEPLSLELLQIARTNAAARQIVQEFNIQWTPNPSVAAPGPAPGAP